MYEYQKVGTPRGSNHGIISEFCLLQILKQIHLPVSNFPTDGIVHSLCQMHSLLHLRLLLHSNKY